MISLLAAASAADLEGHGLANEFGRVLMKDGAEWRALHGWFSPEEFAVFQFATTRIASIVMSQCDQGASPSDQFAAFMAEHGLMDV